MQLDTTRATLASIGIWIVEPQICMLLSSVLEALTKQRHRSWSEVTGAAGYVTCNMWAFCWFKPEESIGLNACVFFSMRMTEKSAFTLHQRKPEWIRRPAKPNDSIADGMLLVNEVGMAPRMEIATTGSKQHDRTGAQVLQLCFSHYFHPCFVWYMGKLGHVLMFSWPNSSHFNHTRPYST